MIIVTMTWKSAGSTMLIYLATIQSIDPELYEATRVSGASFGTRLRYVTLPALWKNVKLLLIMQIISIFQIFYEPLIFMGSTSDSANTLGLLIYKYLYGASKNGGYAAALGVVTMMILLAFTFVYLYFDSKTNIQTQKQKAYLSYEELLGRQYSKLMKKMTLYQANDIITKKTKRRQDRIIKLDEKKRLRLEKSSKKNATPRFMLKMFKKKTSGILAYSDYKSPRNVIYHYIFFIVLALMLFVILIPFIWLFFTSFKSLSEFMQKPNEYSFFPQAMNFGKYVEVIKSTQILKNMGNSLLVAIGSAICSVLFNGILAYVISVLKPKGSKILFYLILASMLIPITVSLLPLTKNINDFYEFIGRLFGGHAKDVQKTFLAYIPLWLIAGASPFNFLLFKTYFDSIPKDIFEMARLEGASKIKIFFKIIIPLSLPIIMVVSIFSITAAWNDFLIPYVLISNNDMRTVMIKIFEISSNLGQYGIMQDQFLCLLLFTMIPPMIVFFIFQKNITSNVATAGLK
jgi:multiple sugar transport system permease protein